MKLLQIVAPILGVVGITTPAAAQTTVTAQGDTVVLIVKSPRGHEVAFSGTVVLKDAKTTRRFDNVTTPFELRLPKQDIDASFTADDGNGLNGEIVVFKGGEQQGHVWGTVYRGSVKLHVEPGRTFGFGGRRKDTRAIP
jgi:hypothetical protein